MSPLQTTIPHKKSVREIIKKLCGDIPSHAQFITHYEDREGFSVTPSGLVQGLMRAISQAAKSNSRDEEMLREKMPELIEAFAANEDEEFRRQALDFFARVSGVVHSDR